MRTATSLLAALAISVGAYAQEPNIAPGGSFDFTNAGEGRVIPDQIAGSREFIPPNFATFDDDVVPLSTLAISTVPFLPTTAEVVQSSGFAVDGDGSRPIQAQISGSVSVKGFLVIRGAGQAGFDVVAELVDVTDDPSAVDPDTIVAMQHIRSYEISGDPEMSVSVEADGQLGSFTVGQLGLAVSAEVAVPMCKKIVRDELPFAFQALVKTGHSYRINVRCVGSSRMEGFGGLGVVSFFSPLAPVPGELINTSLLTIPPVLFDPAALVASLDFPILTQSPFVNIPIPNVGGLTLRVPVYDLPVVGSFGGQTITLSQPFTGLFGNPDNLAQLLESQDLPTTAGDLLTRFFDTTVPEQALDLPGVDVRRLEIAIQDDPTQQLAELRRDIAELQALVMTIADNGGGGEGEGEGDGDGEGNGDQNGVQCAGAFKKRSPPAMGDALLIAAGMTLALAMGLTIKRPARRTQPG